MKAIVCEKFGAPEVLQLKEVDKPIPKDDEVLVRNYASSINTVDIMSRSGKAPKVIFWAARKMIGPLLRLFMLGVRRPRQKIPGYGFSGEIVSVGKDVVNWKKGDQVYGYSEGACAEYLAVPTKRLAIKPSNMSHLEAGAVVGGASPAILAFRDLAKPEKGQKVLVIGASGGIGTFGIQIAKIYGAVVTGVCGPSNLEMVTEIGADFVIDYTTEDYVKRDEKFDIIFDAVGANTLSNCMNILAEDGVYVSNNFMNSSKHILQSIFGKKLKTGVANEGPENLDQFREWIEEGKLRAVIDTVYPLEQTAEAHRHYETGHSKGRVVISID